MSTGSCIVHCKFVAGCYRSKKGCRYGNSCHFSHEQSNTRLAPTSAPPPSATAMDEEAAADAEPPVAAEAAAMPAEDASIDNSKAVVLYDPEVAEANLLKAARSRKRKPGTELQMAQCSKLCTVEKFKNIVF